MRALPARKSWLSDVERWSTPVMANILWALGSVLVVTIPLALVGLLGVMFRWTTNRNAPVFPVFFGTIRRAWRKAYLAAAFDLALGGLVLLNLRIFERMSDNDLLLFISRGVTLSVALLLVLVNLYLWTLIAVWDAPFRRLLKLSVQLVFAQPLWTFAVGIGCAATLIFSLMLPMAVFVVATGAAAAFIACRGMYFVITKYVLPSEIPLLELD
jgi:uncharacterized membrane protein YesL